jgi:alkyl hydroperoxide reductase subunit F
MVDGALAQDEVARLGIQGVPSVVVDGKLLHSGKSGFLELLLKLEAHFGKSEAASGPRELGHYDVVVVGGGPAGVTAAIYSARKGLKTALIAERMGGQLQDTKGIENMISVPYTEGVELAARLSEHLARYEVQVLEHRRVGEIDRERTSAGRRVNLESGETLLADAIILATGARWRELGIPGEREHLGQGVAFCAHCDGPFYRDRRVVVVGGGNSGVEAAIDLAGIAKEVVLLEYGKALRADGVLVDKLRSLSNARIVTQAKSTRVLGEGGKVVGLEYQDLSQVGSSASADASLVQLGTDGVFVQIGLSPNTHFVAGLLELSPGGEIVVDAKGRTSVPGIYAAGDVTPIPFKQIVTALGDGAKAALTAFEDRLRS